MRDTVNQPTTRAARVVAALQRLDARAGINTDAVAVLIEHHAPRVHSAMLDVLAAHQARGHDIGHDNNGTAFARPRSSTAGPARELRDLRLICRKAITGKISREDWTTAWAAQPDRIRSVWRPSLVETPEGRTIDRSTLAMGFETEGFAMLVPKPEVVLPAIERELAAITVSPRPKTRERDVIEAEAIETIRAAYRAITGHKGGRVISLGKLAGRLITLGRELDGIFGTALFATDSTRLR